MPEDYRNGHSAEVSMHLHLNGWALAIAQLGPDFLILEQPKEHPPANAEITLVIDGTEERWAVRLPGGLCSNNREVALAKV